jgi:hypothetical protein
MNKLFSLILVLIVSAARADDAGQYLVERKSLATAIGGMAGIQTNVNPLQFSEEWRRSITYNRTQSVLYVSPSGNNATAARGSITFPWRDIFSIVDAEPGAVITTGAVTRAVSGDTIVVLPGVYVQHKIPLPDGVHLVAPYGATILQTNDVIPSGFGSVYGISLGQGPFVTPGNNSVVSGINFVCLSNTDYNASVGWYVGGNFDDGIAAYGFTDAATTNSLFRNCYFQGTTDAIYLSDTNRGATAPDITFDGCVIRSGWDLIRSFGSNHVLYTRYCDFYTTNTFSKVTHSGASAVLGSSRGVVLTSPMNWYDIGSRFIVGGGTNENCATWIDGGAAAQLYGSRFIVSATAKAYGTNLPSLFYGTSPTGVFFTNGIPTGL